MAYTPGSGSLLKVTITATPTTIAQQSKFGAITKKRARIDVTGLADTLEVLKPGIKRFDAVAFEGWYDPADTTHQYLQTSYAGALTEAWTIVEADAGAANITFSGWLEQLAYGEQAVDGYVTISGLIVLTTDITVTP
jgi:hypothetical protein